VRLRTTLTIFSFPASASLAETEVSEASARVLTDLERFFSCFSRRFLLRFNFLRRSLIAMFASL
jgi:hypothetical protein